MRTGSSRTPCSESPNGVRTRYRISEVDETRDAERDVVERSGSVDDVADEPGRVPVDAADRREAAETASPAEEEFAITPYVSVSIRK